MHIPDAYLSPATQAATFCAMVPLWIIAVRRTSRELSSRQTPLLSVGAAFCFAVQMFNIPALGGTSAHALGTGLLAILIGPWSALLGVTLTLAIQALLFGDGGILSLSANCFDMGLVACFVSYGLFLVLSRRCKAGSGRWAFAAGMSAYAGTVAASLSAGTLLGIQPWIAHDIAGHALYCPFGLNVAVPAMVLTHLLTAGPVEAILTISASLYLWRAFPELIGTGRAETVGMGRRLARRLIWVLAATPLGLLAGGFAWGEWDSKTLTTLIGYTPAGIAHSHEVIHPLMRDYGFADHTGKPWEIAGYLVSAFLGCALVVAFSLALVRRAKQSPVRAVISGSISNDLPEWMRRAECPRPVNGVPGSPWLERTALRMRATIEETIGTERVARTSGLLQSIHPSFKAVIFLGILVAISLGSSLEFLFVTQLILLGVAHISKVPLRGLLTRVLGSVAFFGIVVAVPISMQTVTPGPTAFSVLGVGVSQVGIHAAALMLLRLSAAISTGLIWHLTTRWNDIFRSLRMLGIPLSILSAMAMTYRYLFVVLETLGEMVQARMSRQAGSCTKEQARLYAGNGTGVLFAKSVALTEEIHFAMQSRSVHLNRAGKAERRARKAAGPSASTSTSINPPDTRTSHAF